LQEELEDLAMSTRNSGSGLARQAGQNRDEATGTATFGAFVRKPGARRVTVDASADAKRPATAAGIEPVDNLPEDAVEVGAIVDAYGLKGWVKIAPHASAANGGNAMLAAKQWWLVKGRERKSASCLQSKVHGDTVVAHLSGADDRDAALALRGHSVHVSRRDFPKLADENEFYWVDLIGLAVENEAGEALGHVADMIDNGAHSIMRVEYPASANEGAPKLGERLIPFVGAYVKTVDQAAKKIVVDWDADY
jgi:16S rRNA processing protein RimM